MLFFQTPALERFPRRARWLTEDDEVREGTAVERNGNLTWVEDDGGGGDWIADFEFVN